MAQQAGAVQALVDALAVVFVLLRVAYIALYVADRAALRSVVSRPCGPWHPGLGGAP